MNRRLRLALLLSFVFHGLLVVTGCYRLGYDAYTHMFFADHYRRTWWVLWEPRWYAGFSVVSYPPLVHQLIAIFSFLVGIEVAWAIVLLGVLVALPAGVYVFARLFVGSHASGYAALITSVLPSIFLTAHAFGQLPTLAGLLGVLWSLAMLGRYLCDGRRHSGILAVMLVAVVAASHHGTLLFLPWGMATIGLHTALNRKVSLPHILRRFLLFSVAAVIVALIVIWPLWQWGMGQTMQVPIDHLSRHNFLGGRAPTMFFWPMYGPLVLIIPWLLRAIYKRRRIALGILFLVMFTLGLGGTTPVPRWLYGQYWEWLTYDRFALWASVVLLPFVGRAAVILKHTSLRRSQRTWSIVGIATLVATGLVAFMAALFPSLFPTQPEPVDMHPIVDFLAEGNRAQWRYLTFGFGDQMARLPVLTNATTIDGSYHTARRLPELRSSGLGQIDTAYWLSHGMDALDSILDQLGKYGVRWGFVNLDSYEPLLVKHGWVQLTTLTNGIRVWENRTATRPVYDDPATHSNSIAAASWGTLPLIALTLAIGFTWMEYHLSPAQTKILEVL
jgi:hypothetical protein